MDELPIWAEQLRRERRERGWSQKELAKKLAETGDRNGIQMPERASLIRSVKNWEAGRYRPRDPYPLLLSRVFDLDESELFADEPLWPVEDVERLAHVLETPRRLDSAVIRSLSDVLAAQRRAEDAIGSAPLLGVVSAQLAIVEPLVVDARGALRTPILDIAAQWAQFAGWLNANSARPVIANRWYDRALEWATETGDRNMTATAMNMKGYLGWISGHIGPLLGLSQAAQRDRQVSPGVRALAAQQEARGHALVGDRDSTDRKLDEAAELALKAADHPEDEPPWVYFFGTNYLEMQRGLAYRLLGRPTDAIELIERGLSALPADVRRSEWAAQYLLYIAEAHAATGDTEAARAVAAIVEEIARSTASPRLHARLRDLTPSLES